MSIKCILTSIHVKLYFVPQAEEDALDILDDALFLLSREDDDNALNRKVGDFRSSSILMHKVIYFFLGMLHINPPPELDPSWILPGGEAH